jgi:D-proline reductase (dithiol) PrdB
VSLISRHLEANGMPTVIVGSALDIVEHCAVARFLFVDFPLGNPCGRPWDAAMQRRIVHHAVTLFESATEPRTTVRSPESWGDDSWRERYMQVTDGNRDELARQGQALRRARQNRVRRPEPDGT